MKRIFTHLFVLLLLLSASIPAISQKVLEYDFVTKKFNTNNFKKVESGENITIKVKNINTILYDVEVKINNTTYHTTPPALFLQYFPTIDKIPSAINSIEKATIFTDTSKKNKIDSHSIHNSRIYNTEDIIQLYIQYYGTLRQYLTDLCMLTAFVQSPIVSDQLVIDIQKYNANLSDVVTSLSENIDQLDAEYLQFDELYTDSSSVELQKLKAIKSLTDSIRSQINISDLISLWQIADTNNLSFVSPPIEALGDNMAVEITIKPKGDSTSIIQSSLKGEIVKTNIAVYNKFQLSFSTGIFGSALANEQFSAKQNYAADTITNYSIKKENNGSFVAGPTALLHAAYKFTPSFTFGGHLGVGIPINENPNPQYLAGLSFLFGNKERIGFNISYALGQVKRLSADTDDSITYKDKPTINVINRWQGNIAFSITYNIFTP